MLPNPTPMHQTPWKARTYRQTFTNITPYIPILVPLPTTLYGRKYAIFRIINSDLRYSWNSKLKLIFTEEPAAIAFKKEKKALILTNSLLKKTNLSYFSKNKVTSPLISPWHGTYLVDSIFALTTLSFGINRQFDWRPIANADTESAHIPLWIAAVPSEQ